MSYIPGYQFKVSASRTDKEILYPKLYPCRYSLRDKNTPFVELEDQELVKVLAYEDGALKVERLKTKEVGYLG